MLKNLKIFWKLFENNIKKAMIYRANFVITAFSMTLWIGVYILFFEVLFLHVDNVAGWNKAEMLTFLAFYYLSQSIGAILFRDGFEKFSDKMRRGEIDFALTKPASKQILLFFDEVRFDHIIDVVFFVLLFGYIILYTDAPITTPLLLLGIAISLIAQLLYYGLLLMTASVIFFFERFEALGSFIWHMSQISRYPRQIFTGITGIMVQFIFPIALTAAVPAEFALNQGSFKLALFISGMSVLMFVLGLSFFNLGLKHYESAN